MHLDSGTQQIPSEEKFQIYDSICISINTENLIVWASYVTNHNVGNGLFWD